MAWSRIGIREALDAVLASVEGLGPDARSSYARAAARVGRWYEARGVGVVDAETNDALVATLDLDPARQHLADRYAFRVVRMAEDVAAGRGAGRRHVSPAMFKHDLDARHRLMAEDLLGSTGLSDGTVAGVASTVRSFMHELQERGVDGPCEVDPSLFPDFAAAECASRPGSARNVSYALGLVCEWMRSKGFSGVPDDPTPAGVGCARERVLPAMPADVVRAVLASPDRSTGIGMRDYAVLLLASTTGMRACDVAALSLSDVDWRAGTVAFTQRKTGAAVALPLLGGVLRAIADYELSGRPETGCGSVFVRAAPPFGPLSAGGVRDVLYRHMALAGVEKSAWDGMTFHALRRGLGAWLLEAGSDADEIAQILGHSDRATLRRYLPLAPDGMRDCAIGLDGIECASGALS